jgi:hypothetical protein
LTIGIPLVPSSGDLLAPEDLLENVAVVSGSLH